MESPSNIALDGAAPLAHLGVIRVEGADAVSFLQGQLTQDFALLKPTQARLAGYCSPKGRLLASFVGWRSGPTDVLLVCGLDILAPTLKRLSMFVMRAKAKLSDATAEFSLYGLAGTALAAAGGSPEPWSRTDAGGATVVTLYPADGRPRGLWVAPAGTPAPAGAPLSPTLWHWSGVRSGVADVTAPIVEAFVPQMLNYESVGGVNFKKGCYPGQEVVARSQFRGTLKRRAYRVHAEGAPEGALSVGQEVFHASDSSQPCGTIVQVAAAPGGGLDAIVSMQVAAADGGALTAAGADGAPGVSLALLPLPYLLLEDV